MSVCQYIASEVHKPVLSTASDNHFYEAKPAKKKAATKKTAAAATPAPNTGAKAAPAKAKPAAVQQPSTPTVDPPAPIVSQIMEMGFPRRHIEFAMQVNITVILSIIWYHRV